MIKRTKRGDAKMDVAAWQRHLVAHGFDPGPIDGIHGRKTEAASVAYGEANDEADTDPSPSAPESTPETPRFLPAMRTPASPAEVYAALTSAWRAQLSESPKRQSIIVLLAQWAHETGVGKSIWCWNLGNVKTKPNGAHHWTFFPCGEEVKLSQAQKMISDVRVTIVKRYTNSSGVQMASIKIVPTHPACCFRAFHTLDDGAADFLELLHKRFRKAWPAVLAGDPAQFSKLLRESHYYTASEASYTKALKRHHDNLSDTIV